MRWLFVEPSDTAIANTVVGGTAEKIKAEAGCWIPPCNIRAVPIIRANIGSSTLDPTYTEGGCAGGVDQAGPTDFREDCLAAALIGGHSKSPRSACIPHPP